MMEDKLYWGEALALLIDKRAESAAAGVSKDALRLRNTRAFPLAPDGEWEYRVSFYDGAGDAAAFVQWEDGARDAWTEHVHGPYPLSAGELEALEKALDALEPVSPEALAWSWHKPGLGYDAEALQALRTRFIGDASEEEPQGRLLLLDRMTFDNAADMYNWHQVTFWLWPGPGGAYDRTRVYVVWSVDDRGDRGELWSWKTCRRLPREEAEALAQALRALLPRFPAAEGFEREIRTRSQVRQTEGDAEEPSRQNTDFKAKHRRNSILLGGVALALSALGAVLKQAGSDMGFGVCFFLMLIFAMLGTTGFVTLGETPGTRRLRTLACAALCALLVLIISWPFRA